MENNTHRSSVEILEAGRIQNQVSGYYQIQVVDSIDSTNTWMKEHARSLPEGSVLFARMQTRGRGRNGRSFQAQPDGGLYFSLLLHPEALPEGWKTLMPAAVGLGVIRAIEACTGLHPVMKWINDIELAGRKVAGILCETLFQGSHADCLIVGIGLNVRPIAFDRSLAPHAGALEDVLPAGSVSLNDLAAQILNCLEPMLNMKDLSGILEDYRACSSVLGRRVEVEDVSGRWQGSVRDIDDTGALWVEKGEHLIRLDHGEIHLNTIPADAESAVKTEEPPERTAHLG